MLLFNLRRQSGSKEFEAPPAFSQIVSRQANQQRANIVCREYAPSPLVMHRLLRLMVRLLLLLFAGCFTSQQHASVSQGRICSETFTCCHTKIEVADQTPNGKASVSRAEDSGSIPAFAVDNFAGRVMLVTSKLALQWLPCQGPGVIRSAPELVGPVSVDCDWVRQKVRSATSISMWQHVHLSEQIRPRGTLACCWDVKQAINNDSCDAKEKSGGTPYVTSCSLSLLRFMHGFRSQI